jgi:dCTP deaminase
MRLLRDSELIHLYEGQSPVITGIDVPKTWTDAKSPVQPSSIDLHIGKICVPAERESDPPSERISGRHSLIPGQTAIVTTRENLRMRPNLSAIGFPPAHVSVQGILMTNPGHIDPGYHGPMHLTVINMGRDSYDLMVDAPIVTLLLFELDADVSADYSARNPGAFPEPDVNKLSRDFVNVENRARNIARNAITRAGIYGAIGAAVLTIATQILPYYLGGIEEVKRNQAVLTEQVVTLRDKVKALEGEHQSVHAPGSTAGMTEAKPGEGK